MQKSYDAIVGDGGFRFGSCRLWGMNQPASFRPLHPPLQPLPLTAVAFEPFGLVLQPSATGGRAINAGTAERFDLVDDLQLHARGGHAQLAMYRARARGFPMEVQELERHRWGSQTFVPWGRGRFVVVVAPAGPPPQANALRAFVTDGRQGIMLSPGTWHHALLAVDAADFLVIERAAPAVDCDVHALDTPRTLLPP